MHPIYKVRITLRKKTILQKKQRIVFLTSITLKPFLGLGFNLGVEHLPIRARPGLVPSAEGKTLPFLNEIDIQDNKTNSCISKGLFFRGY